MGGAHPVCPVAELPPGERKIVVVAGRSIGVFNVGGTYYALRNSCPHKAAPLCLGPITGLVTGPRPGQFVVLRQGEVVRCPWHGWEFDITTGRSLFNPHRVRVRRYEVSVEHGADVPGGDIGGAAATTAISEAIPTMTDEGDPSIETFAVTVEQDWVVLHLDQ